MKKNELLILDVAPKGSFNYEIETHFKLKIDKVTDWFETHGFGVKCTLTTEELVGQLIDCILYFDMYEVAENTEKEESFTKNLEKKPHWILSGKLIDAPGSSIPSLKVKDYEFKIGSPISHKNNLLCKIGTYIQMRGVLYIKEIKIIK